MKRVVAIVAAAVSLALVPAVGAYNDDPGGTVLPSCGADQYYVVYNFDHTIWTCVMGSWYFTGTWY